MRCLRADIRRTLTARLAALALTASTALTQGTLRTELLPGLVVPPWGESSSLFVAVSGDGQWVYGTSLPFSGVRAVVRWRRGGPAERIPELDLPAVESIATSFDGRVVLASYELLSSERAFVLWSEGQGIRELTEFVSAGALSADGSVAVGSVRLGNGAVQAATWTLAGGYVPFGPASVPGQGSNQRSSVGFDCSSDASVLAGSHYDGTRVRPFVWTASGGTTLLGFLQSSFLSYPSALSGDGTVIVGQAVSPLGSLPVRWDVQSSGPPQVLAQGFGNAADVSYGGDLIVGAATLGGVIRGVTWRSNGAITELDLGGLAPNSVGIRCSYDGSIIAGSAFEVVGTGLSPRAFLGISPGELGTSYCAAAPNSVGSGALLSIAGSPVQGHGTLGLVVTDLPLQSAGIFLVSATQGFVANPAGSQGDLCLGGMIGRFLGPNQVQSSGSIGSFRLDLDPATMPSPIGPVAVTAGSTWNFQAWYRDVTSNFSDAVSLTIL